MLRIYYIPISNENSVINDQADILDNFLSFRIPWEFWSYVMGDDNRSNDMLDYFTLADNTQCDTAQFYFNFKYPEILGWRKS